MPSLGRAMADALIEIGIATPEQLRALGPEETFRRLRFAHGRKITLTWIYALDIAIRGGTWASFTPARAKRLRNAAEAILTEVRNAASDARKG